MRRLHGGLRDAHVIVRRVPFDGRAEGLVRLVGLQDRLRFRRQVLVIVGVLVRVDDLRRALLVGGPDGERFVVLDRDGEGAHALRRDAAAGDVEADHEARRVDDDVVHLSRPELVEERVGAAPAHFEKGCEARLLVGARAPLDFQRGVEGVRLHVWRGFGSLEPLCDDRGLRANWQRADVAAD